MLLRRRRRATLSTRILGANKGPWPGKGKIFIIIIIKHTMIEHNNKKEPPLLNLEGALDVRF